MIPSLSSLPRFSIALEKNPWADFVELSCLMSKDGEISLSDMVEISIKEIQDGPERGSDETGEQEDSFNQSFRDIFKYLKNRSVALSDFYPFNFIDDDTISIEVENLSSKNMLYLFLLYCSNLSHFSKSDQSRLTRDFEAISMSILAKVYPTFQVNVFGTASASTDLFYGGNLIERFEKLADCIHTEVTVSTRRNERYKRPSGDGGMDLVAFAQLDDVSTSAPYIPLCFVQCACSVSAWKEKQQAIKFDSWNQRFEQIAHYAEFIFVPFSLRGPDGKWSSTEEDRITVIPIDRFRFLHIIKLFGDNMFFFEQGDAYDVISESIKSI